MKRPLRSLFALLATACGLATSPSASAQWTSAYPFVAVAASFNGFNSFDPNLELISNGVWVGYFNIPVTPSGDTNRFLFTTTNFSNNWKESNQSDFTVPMADIAEFNGSRDIVISNNPAGTFRLQFNESTRAYSVDDVTPGSAAGELWINEFHYDNAGDDSNEFVEVMGRSSLNLTNYQLVLYNGNNGASYETRTLSGILPNQANGFGTAIFTYTNKVQNGAPDAIALVKRSPASVLWFISYEGSFTAADGPAVGLTSTDIGVSENGSQWDFSLQLTGQSGDYPGFTWIGPTNRTPGALNLGQGVATGSPAVSITFSNLVHSPSPVTSNSSVYVDVDIYPILGATNIFATTFYRVTNTMAKFLPLPMSRTGNHHRTFSPIPAQPPGYRVEYYIFAHYTGNGTNSPDVFPSTAPSSIPSYGVLRSAPGAIWVNEVNPVTALFGDETDTEFVELIGVAGSDISNWKVQFFTDPNGLPNDSFTIPAGTVLGNQTNGFGFFTLGVSDVPGVDISWPSTNNIIPDAGGLRIFNDFNDEVYALNWGDDTVISWSGFQFIGIDLTVDGTNAISLTGTGGTYSSFVWSTNVLLTASGVNVGQTLTGGNTNSLAPFIQCPSNIFLNCPGSAIPTANVAAVVATGYCGSGAVTVTLASSVTNAGSGCFGSPIIVTRTYRAVSTCGTMSDCQQIIRVEDTSPPSLVTSTSALVNAGFEVGDFSDWTTYGAGVSNITIGSDIPKSGFRHASLAGASSSVMLDSTGNKLNGLYFGQPTRGQLTTNKVNGTAVLFSGTNQYAEVPYDGLLNGSTFAAALWVKPLPWTNGTRGLLSSRQFTISEVSGYHLQLSASNTVEFWTGDGVFWDVIYGPPVTNLAWSHIVGVVSNNGGIATKQLWMNGVLNQQRIITNYQPNASQPLRLAAGATEAAARDFFPGWMDDVRVLDEPITPAQIASIYSTTGGVTLGTETALFKMDETNTVAGVSTSGFHQALAAVSGQTWTASAWALIPSTDPLRGTNQAYLTLSYLNSTGSVLSTITSRILNASSPVTNFLRLSARGTAPSNTASARLTTVFKQDAAGSGGTVYFDDAVLSTLVVIMPSNACPTMPNLMSLVTATDSCPGTVTTTQTPTNGAVLSVTNSTVIFRATDGCGLVTTVQVPLVVVDDFAPTITQPTSIVASCTNSVPVPNPATITAVDNCGPVVVTWESDTTLGGNVCQATNPVRISRIYRATDQAGNFNTSTQSITVVDTNPPSMNCTLPQPLANNGFESVSSFSSWNTFGVNKFVVTNAPRSGTRHALVKGSGSGGDNFTGFYQDISARSGQTWRIAGYAMTPTSNRISGASTCDIKLEFLGASGLISTHFTPPITSNLAAGVYSSFSTSAVAPAGTTIARFTVVYIQRGGAAGEVFIDDASLSMTTLSASGISCQATLPNLAPAISVTDCGTVSITQVPPTGTLVGLGDTPVNLIAMDACGLTRTCTVVVTAVDDVCASVIPPEPTNVTVVAISMGTNITVRSLGTNSWSVLPEYTTNLISPQTWLPVTTWTNSHANGTNITSFNPPVTNSPVLFRIWQKYP